jgi:hypothetical protein
VLGGARSGPPLTALSSATPPARRFPSPWTIDEHNNACFIVKDATGQTIGACLPSEVNDLTWARLAGAVLDP